MEEQQVLDAQRLEQQHHVGQVGPLDLRNGGHQHLVLIGTISVQPASRQTVVEVVVGGRVQQVKNMRCTGVFIVLHELSCW